MKCLLDDAFKPGGERAAEQSAEESQIARQVQLLGIDAHVDIEAFAREAHRILITRPIDALNHPRESPLHLADRRLHSRAGFIQRLAMVHG